MTTYTDEAFGEVCDLIIDMALGQHQDCTCDPDTWEVDHTYNILETLDVDPDDPNVNAYCIRIADLFAWLRIEAEHFDDIGDDLEAAVRYVASDIIGMACVDDSIAACQAMWNRS
jgi:hypothetical protein